LRRSFEDDLAAILLAEDWPDESFPISARLSGLPMKGGRATIWRVEVAAAGPTRILGDPGCLGFVFFAHSGRDHRRRVARRLHRWAEEAWAAGLRRLGIEIADRSRFSSHALIEAHARAARWDAQWDAQWDTEPVAASRTSR